MPRRGTRSAMRRQRVDAVADRPRAIGTPDGHGVIQALSVSRHDLDSVVVRPPRRVRELSAADDVLAAGRHLLGDRRTADVDGSGCVHVSVEQQEPKRLAGCREKPRDLYLSDPEAISDLALGETLEEREVDDRALSIVQPSDEFAADQPILAIRRVVD